MACYEPIAFGGIELWVLISEIHLGSQTTQRKSPGRVKGKRKIELLLASLDDVGSKLLRQKATHGSNDPLLEQVPLDGLYHLFQMMTVDSILWN